MLASMSVMVPVSDPTAQTIFDPRDDAAESHSFTAACDETLMTIIRELLQTCR